MSPEEHLWGILDPICIVFLFIIFAYLIIMEAYVGWTIGKRRNPSFSSLLFYAWMLIHQEEVAMAIREEIGEG